MAYQCKCGNNEEFLEVFETAIDVVDGSGNFIMSEVKNVAYYVCRKCDRDIPYEEFFPLTAVASID